MTRKDCKDRKDGRGGEGGRNGQNREGGKRDPNREGGKNGPSREDPKARVLEDSFSPVPWLQGPHRQTMVGTLWPARYPRGLTPAMRQEVSVPGPDRLGVLVTQARGGPPPPRGRLVLLHGLGGWASSRYMVRTTVAAHRRGWEVARVHFRGAEPGMPGGVTFHNAGRSEDVEAVLDQVLWSEAARESPLTAVGFSLGGAVLLKYLGEKGGGAPLAAAAAISAPLDLATCLTELDRPRNRIYHLYYVARQRRQIRAKVKAHRGVLAPLQRWMDTVRKLDEVYIAPDAGYPDADAYYSGASCRPLLPAIAVPTLLLSARDDPFIPAGLYEGLRVGDAPIESMLTTRGGHVGYIATGPRGPWFWAADAILDWLESRT